MAKSTKLAPPRIVTKMPTKPTATSRVLTSYKLPDKVDVSNLDSVIKKTLKAFPTYDPAIHSLQLVCSRNTYPVSLRLQVMISADKDIKYQTALRKYKEDLILYQQYITNRLNEV